MTIPTPEQRQAAHICTSNDIHHHTSVFMIPQTNTSVFDRIGIALSGICAVHCLILPAVLPFMGMIAGIIESEWTHIVLAIFIIPTVVFTAWRGYKHHGKREVMWLLGIGALAVVAALFVGEHLANERLETAVTTLGSLLLITGHWQNHKHCSLCASGKPHVH